MICRCGRTCGCTRAGYRPCLLPSWPLPIHGPPLSSSSVSSSSPSPSSQVLPLSPVPVRDRLPANVLVVLCACRSESVGNKLPPTYYYSRGSPRSVSLELWSWTSGSRYQCGGLEIYFSPPDSESEKHRVPSASGSARCQC
jgi:hypothetical protein